MNYLKKILKPKIIFTETKKELICWNFSIKKLLMVITILLIPKN